MGLNPREKSERQFDGSKQIIPGNGVKTVQKKENPFEDIIKKINDEPGSLPTPPPTPSMTATPTITPSITPSVSITPTITPSSSVTPTITPTKSPNVTPSVTPTLTPSQTQTPTQTPTITPTKTPTQTPTQTPTKTPTQTPTQTPTKTPTQTPTQTPTKTPTKTPTQTPTKTPTQTPTKTPTKTPTQTPSMTQTPTVTPSITPTNTQTPTVTPSMTQTPTVTPSITPSITPSPSRVSLIGPFFKFANVIGQPTSLIFNTFSGQTFDIRWGDGTFTNAVPINQINTDITYSKPLRGSIFTGSSDNFRVLSANSVNRIYELEFRNVSGIEENQFTFSGFSDVTFIKVANSTITSFNHSLPSTLKTLELSSIIGPQNLTFNPVFTNRAPFRNLTISTTNIKSFNYAITGGTGDADQIITMNANVSLTSITLSVSSVLNELNITNNSSLSILNIPNQLTAATNMLTLNVSNNTNLTGWTYNLPSSLENFTISQNNISSINIDFNGNTNLERISAFAQTNRRLSAVTETISACTSLQYVRFDQNSIVNLPPIFPNSVISLAIQDNKITGYTSNIPTGLQQFNASADVDGNNVFTNWTTPLTPATGLRDFFLNNVRLSDWSVQFPPSIRWVQFRDNKLSNFNFNNVSGAITVDLDGNPLVTLSALQNNNTIETLKLNETAFSSPNAILPPSGNFPPTLRRIEFASNPNMTTWNKSFASAPLLYYVTFENTPLDQTSVDYILEDLALLNNQSNGVLILNRSSGTPAGSGPAVPTNGLNNTYRLILVSRNWNVQINTN